MEKKYLDVAFEVKAIDESGIFEGYGSTFGVKDSHNDVVMPGAFTKTLQAGGRNKNGIAMLFSHDAHRPIGVWTSLEEDKKGLKVEGKLALKTQDGKETWELMRLGALRGLSIGYDCKIHEYDDKKKIRYLKELDLWEISPVVFPANTHSNVQVVKAIGEAKTKGELQNTLSGAGFSEAATGYLVKMYKPGTADEGGILSVLDTLRETNRKMYEDAAEGHKDLLAAVERMGAGSAEGIETLWQVAEMAIRKLEAVDVENMTTMVDEHLAKAIEKLVSGRLASTENRLRRGEMSTEPEAEEERAYVPSFNLDDYDTQRRTRDDPFEYYNVKITPATGGGRLANCIEIGPVGT